MGAQGRDGVESEPRTRCRRLTPMGTATDRDAELPLTAAQSGIWYAQQFAPDNPVYAIADYVEIDGPIDVPLLQDAVRRTLIEAEAPHALGAESDDGPSQRVERPRDVRDIPVELLDL